LEIEAFARLWYAQPHTHTYIHTQKTKNNPTQFRKQKKSIFSRLFSSLGRTKSSSLHTKKTKKLG
jgi:hypothetical protein